MMMGWNQAPYMSLIYHPSFWCTPEEIDRVSYEWTPHGGITSKSEIKKGGQVTRVAFFDCASGGEPLYVMDLRRKMTVYPNSILHLELRL
jgi:hypothetical protein